LDTTEYSRLTPQEAIELQKQLRSKVRLEDDFGEIRIIAGVDVQIGHGWS
jgi:deoxyinosine 3'endonuclease (endonuclease V)